ncbi:peptidase domain-containing ABC transporter [Spirosoma humi]
MVKKFPFYKQLDQRDCGPTCLRMVAQYHGRMLSQEYLREKAFLTREGASLGGLAEAAETIGLQSLAVSVPLETLQQDVPLPCIAYWRQRHFVVVHAIKKGRIQVADPGYGLLDYSSEEFCRGWLNSKHPKPGEEGIVLVLEPSPAFYEETDDVSTAKQLSPSFWLRYFRPYRALIGQLMLGLGLGSLLQVVFPFLTQSLIDYGINFNNRSFIYIILLAQLVLFSAQTLVQVFRDWLLIHMTSRINIRMQSDYLIKLMRLSVGFFDSKNIGDLLQRIQRDHARIQNFMSAVTLRAIFSLLEILVFGSILALYNLTIFGIFLAGAVFYIGWTFLFLKRRRLIDYRYFDEGSGQQSSLVQLINGVQEIKLNGSERRRRWEWEAIQIRLFRINIKALALNQTQTLGGSVVNQLTSILITFIATKSVLDGQITLGMMLSIQFMLGQLNVPLNDLILFIQNGQDALLSLERISEVYKKTDEDTPEQLSELATDKSIRIENLSFRYGSSTSPLVLDNISVNIPAGKITAIVGTSGSGKTTLIKLLLKFYEPSAGGVRIGNRNLKDINSSFWRSCCGCVMQDGYLFADSIARNVTESASDGFIDRGRLVDAVQMANLETFVDELPTGFNTRVGSSGMNVSGGQKQRLLIARAIYKDPAYLFFDEATSALDANNERTIQDNLDQFFEGRTVLIVAHRLSTVRNADNIIVLEKGCVVEQGTHENLIGQQGAYFTLVKNQLELSE